MKTIDQKPGQRISIVGSAGCGKTTFAKKLSECLHIPCIQLDELFWGENWTKTSDDEFRNKIDKETMSDQWIMDGNYRRMQSLIWSRADTVVFLDYSFTTILWRLLKRTFKRIINQEVLWSGNRENIRNAFFEKDSLILYMIKTFQSRKRTYYQQFQQPEYAHLNIVQLKSPHIAKTWLSNLNKKGDLPS